MNENNVGSRHLKLTTDKSIQKKKQYKNTILNQIFCFYKLLSLKKN